MFFLILTLSSRLFLFALNFTTRHKKKEKKDKSSKFYAEKVLDLFDTFTVLCVILVSIKVTPMEADVRQDRAVLFNVAKKKRRDENTDPSR